MPALLDGTPVFPAHLTPCSKVHIQTFKLQLRAKKKNVLHPQWAPLEWGLSFCHEVAAVLGVKTKGAGPEVVLLLHA
jgi:hypothetical protein